MNKDLFQTERFEKEVLVSEFLAECVDCDRIHAYCQECEYHDKTWSCPSFDFDPMDYWKRYRYLTMTAFKIKVPKELRTLEYPKYMKIEFSDMIMTEWKQMIDDEMLVMEEKLSPATAISGGICVRCYDSGCAKMDGFPCRNPDKMRYSMEALGVDVEKTALHYFGEKLIWVKGGKLPEYFMMIGGVLHDESRIKNV